MTRRGTPPLCHSRAGGNPAAPRPRRDKNLLQCDILDRAELAAFYRNMRRAGAAASAREIFVWLRNGERKMPRITGARVRLTVSPYAQEQILRQALTNKK